MKRTLGVLAAVLLAGCAASSAPAAGSTLKKVEATPAIVAMVQGMVGRDFQLDGLPPESRTLESAFVYITTGSRSDIILEAFKGCATVYGAEMKVDDHGEKLTAFLYASQADFGGARVYVLSDQWHIFRAHR